MNIIDDVKNRFEDVVVETYTQNDGKEGMLIKKESLVDVCGFLYESGFDHLSMISGMDYVEWMEVVYHVWSYTRKENVVLKVKLDRSMPVVDSVVSVWSGADWMERETYDLLGITFENHPDLRRILLPEGWVGHPLRKDYDLTVDQYVIIGEDGSDVVTTDASKLLRKEVLHDRN